MTVFLFADLAGFTAITEAHGDEEATRLVDDFRQLVERHLSSSMRLVKINGDAAMIVSKDAPAALELALSLVAAAELLPGRPAIRIGMHSGGAVERDGDYWGHAVNVAARVAAQARPCEVLLTEDVFRQLGAGAADGRLRDQGSVTLRNVTDPVRLFSVTHDAQLVTDPVCRMRLPPDDGIATIRHQGEVYVFCSMRCAHAFTERPQAYVS